MGEEPKSYKVELGLGVNHQWKYLSILAAKY